MVTLVAASLFMSLMLLTFSTATLQQPIAAAGSSQRGEKLCVQTYAEPATETRPKKMKTDMSPFAL